MRQLRVAGARLCRGGRGRSVDPALRSKYSVKFLSAQPLRRQIVGATCALLLLLGSAIVWSADRTRAEHQEQVRAEAHSVGRLAAAYLNQYFDGLDAMASALMRHPAITT